MNKNEIKQHFRDNKKLYFVGGTGAAVGAAAMFLLTRGNVQIVDSFRILSPSKNTNVVVAQLARRGHPGNVIRCLDTGEVFSSQRRAAELLGINRYELWEHLNGLKPDVSGLKFEKIGEAV